MSALDTHTLIGQATGLVMERYQLTADRALQYLTHVSQHSNISLRHVAAEMVQQANDESVPKAVQV